MEYEVRRFNENDWEDYCAIRLEALNNHPESFCPSRDETKFSENDWKQRISNKNGAVFGLYYKDSIVGLTGIIKENNDEKSQVAHLVMDYIKKDHRGNGLSKKLYEVRIEWALQNNDIKELVVEHRDDNISSQKAHEKFNFKLSSSREKKWPDGKTRPAMIYRLSM